MLYDLAIYSLKAGLCIGIFYLVFKWTMSRETLHRLNRAVLLAGLAASFVLPVWVVTVVRKIPLPEFEPIVWDGVIEAELPAAFPWEQVAGWIFVAGGLAVGGLWLRSLAGVVRIVRRGRKQQLDGRTRLTLLDEPVTPFSWGHCVVMSERDYAENGEVILTHERAHLRLGHSFDLLVVNLACCFQWFNPAMWLLRRDLREIHEYEADEAVLASGIDARTYQLLLIKKAAGGRWYSIANSFNHSKLKNRITMMLQKKSSRWAGAKALLMLPLAGLAVGAFAQTVYVYDEDKGKKEIRIDETAEAENPAYSATIVYDDPARSVVADSLHLIILQEADGTKRLFVNDNEVPAEMLGIIVEDKIRSVTIFKGKSAEEFLNKRRAAGSAPQTGKARVLIVEDQSEYGQRVFIDGQETPNPKALEMLNNDQIESITILKGKSAEEFLKSNTGETQPKSEIRIVDGQELPVEVSMDNGNNRFRGIAILKGQSAEEFLKSNTDETAGAVQSKIEMMLVDDGSERGQRLFVNGQEVPVEALKDVDNDRIKGITILKGKSAEEFLKSKAGETAAPEQSKIEMILVDDGSERGQRLFVNGQEVPVEALKDVDNDRIKGITILKGKSAEEFLKSKAG